MVKLNNFQKPTFPIPDSLLVLAIFSTLAQVLSHSLTKSKIYLNNNNTLLSY